MFTNIKERIKGLDYARRIQTQLVLSQIPDQLGGRKALIKGPGDRMGGLRAGDRQSTC